MNLLDLSRAEVRTLLDQQGRISALDIAAALKLAVRRAYQKHEKETDDMYHCRLVGTLTGSITGFAELLEAIGK